MTKPPRITALNMPFVWVTQDGEAIPFREMRTSHLFYSLRMVFNHIVPPHLQILGCKRYSGIDTWPKERIRISVIALLLELSKRTDVQPWMVDQLRHIRDAVRQQQQDKLAYGQRNPEARTA